MNRQRMLKGAALLMVLGAVAGASTVLGAVAQRSCWPRLCKHAWDKPVATVLETAQARIETETVTLPFAHLYGAMEVLDSSFVLASGDGALYRMAADAKIEKLPFAIPFREDEFYRDNGTEGIQTSSFSVKDILVRSLPGSEVEILASHHVWFPDRKCYTLRVSAAVADKGLTKLRRDWRTVFDAEPCAKVEAKGDGIRFAGTGAGGRMVRMSDAEVLLTVGDHEYDGSIYTLAQDPEASYGKTVLVNTATGKARTFSTGHRNPQGLLRARDGRIWMTEHGPKGGDELNLMQDGRNYGWPLATYGTKYDGRAWPLSASPAQDSAFARPVYAWVPSIGISQLIQVEGKKFTGWAGDLLVASLKATSLYRVHLDGDRVAYAEPIVLNNARIRDLAEHPDGTIALLSRGRMVLLRPAAPLDTAAVTVATADASPSIAKAFVDSTRTLLMDLAKIRRY